MCSESTCVDEIVTLAIGTLFGVSFGFAAVRLRTRQLHFGLGLCCRCSNIFARDHEPFLRCCHSNVDPTELAQHLLCCCSDICTCSAGVMYTWLSCLLLWFQLFSPRHVFIYMIVKMRNTSDETYRKGDNAFE